MILFSLRLQATCGFTCSDEITLIFPAFKTLAAEDTEETEATEDGEKDTSTTEEKAKKYRDLKPPNGGRVVKSVTLFAGFASTSFYKNLMLVLNKDRERNANLKRFANKV